jgi:hypothetical protein
MTASLCRIISTDVQNSMLRRDARIATVAQAAPETEEKIVHSNTGFHQPHARASGGADICRPLVAARIWPGGYLGFGSAQLLRGCAMGALRLQFPALALPLRAARRAGICNLSHTPLIEFNRGWAQHAAALVYLVSKKDFTPPGKTESQFSRTHSFDTGAAWANFANQAALGGWAAHGMSGFDVDAARKALGCPTVSRSRSLLQSDARATALT